MRTSVLRHLRRTKRGVTSVSRHSRGRKLIIPYNDMTCIRCKAKHNIIGSPYCRSCWNKMNERQQTDKEFKEMQRMNRDVRAKVKRKSDKIFGKSYEETDKDRNEMPWSKY